MSADSENIGNGLEIGQGLAGLVDQVEVARLLGYPLDRRIDFALPSIQHTLNNPKSPNPYYIYLRTMGLSAQDVAKALGVRGIGNAEEMLRQRKTLLQQRFLENGLSVEQVPTYGVKALRQEITATASPLTSLLHEKKVSHEVVEQIKDDIAQRYSPEKRFAIESGIKRIEQVFRMLFEGAKAANVIMPKGEDFYKFYHQLAERILGDEQKPLEMFVITCPRYGQQDDYRQLEEGLSLTAQTYLKSLPLIAHALRTNGVSFRGHLIVNDGEANLAEGRFLSRLGESQASYQSKCQTNAKSIREAIGGSPTLADSSVQLFSEAFPSFVALTAQLEKHLFALAQKEQAFVQEIETIAINRLPRHRQIMGGSCSLEESVYLTYHYLAQYISLAYVLKQDAGFSQDSFIVNYNSPNAKYINDHNLLAQCVKQFSGAEIIPVFEIKYY